MSAYLVEVEDRIPVGSHPQPKAPDRQAENVNEQQLHASTLAEAFSEEYRLPGMVKENTTWDVYNNEARKVDHELVKDWTASLNFLLLFAAIFAAVLAAFIIESKKLLEEDPTDVLVDIMILVTTNLANGTHTPYSRNTFEPTTMAISINCLLFASLGASLVAALASVIALQWVADYDAAITRGGSSPEDRAKRRQYRFAGVINWKMGEIIAALPLLLYSSVALFWAGAIQWMWSLHYAVGYVVTAATVVTALFYITTTLVGAMYVSAPFHTPLSRALYWLFGPIITWCYKSIPPLPLRLLRLPMLLLVAIVVILPLYAVILRTWGLFAIPVIAIFLFGAFFISLHYSLWSRFLSWKEAHMSPWVYKHLLPHTTLRQLEDKAAEDDPSFTKEALNWVAQQLIISEDSHRRFLLILNDVSKYSSTESFSEDFFEGPWWAIFHYLGWQYRRRVFSGKLSPEDAEVVGTLVRCANVPAIQKQITPTPGPNYETDPGMATYWNQFYFDESESKVYPETLPVNMTFLLTRDVPIPSAHSKQELETTIKLIKWRNAEGLKDITIWKNVIDSLEFHTPEYHRSCIHLFARLTRIFRERRQTESSFTSLWIASQSRTAIRNQIVETILAFEDFMGVTDDSTVHELFIHLVCGELKRTGYELPSLSSWPEPLVQQVAGIHDPCLAVLAGYVRGVSVSVGVEMNRRYIDKYEYSIKAVRDFLCGGMTPTNPSSALWQLRAEVYVLADSPTLYTNLRAYKEREMLSCLQLIYQYPTYCYKHNTEDVIVGPGPLNLHFACNCHNHSFGLHHILCHLDICSSISIRTLDVPRPWNSVNPITVIFVYMIDNETALFQNLLEDFNPECIEEIYYMCTVVKNHPASFYAFLVDMVHRSLEGASANFPFTLWVLEDAMSLIHDTSLVHTLRPLASVTQRLQVEMQEREERRNRREIEANRVGATRRFLRRVMNTIRERIPWRNEADAEDTPLSDIDSVRSGQIAARLYRKSATVIITSQSHLRVLCCTRAWSSAQPATGWLPEYVGL